MSNVRRRPDRSANEEPASTETCRTEQGPDPADLQWAAENLGNDVFHTDESTPDEILEREAEEYLAIERHQRGIRCY